MGRYANAGMGVTTPQAKSAAAAGLWTIAAADPEPISKAILTVAAMFTQLFGFGYNPRKLADTAITEAVKQGLNVLWYNLTGEALDGVNRTAEPGQYGAQHIALFTPSAYPKVPYPAGPPDVNQIRQVADQARQIIAQGRSNLVRQESFAGYDANADYMLGLMEQVAAAREQQNSQGNVFSSVAAMDWKSLLPWVIGGYAVYEFVL